MDQKTKVTYLAVIFLAVVFGLASLGAVAKNDNAKASKSNKSSQTKINLKKFEVADQTQGQTNSQLHQKKVKEVVANLEEVAQTEEVSGNTAVSTQLEQVAADQEEAVEETTEAIDELEGEGKVKTFLFGTSYKNLGQLRSSLAHNQNDIRKLTRSLAKAPLESQAAIQTELTTLMQERERIKGIIYEKQSDFSLFGWLSRLMTGYVPVPENDPAEAQLTTEVETAIENVPETTDSAATPVTTGATTPPAETAPAANPTQ